MRIIKFSGKYCGQCKAYQRFFDQFKAKHPEINFEEIDVEDREDLIEKYDITSLPTTVVINSNGEPRKFTGILTTERLENIIKQSE